MVLMADSPPIHRDAISGLRISSESISDGASRKYDEVMSRAVRRFSDPSSKIEKSMFAQRSKASSSSRSTRILIVLSNAIFVSMLQELLWTELPIIYYILELSSGSNSDNLIIAGVTWVEQERIKVEMLLQDRGSQTNRCVY
ncbi:hypothetical protein KCU61_g770, partial [Aureobasidium melanogenum]